MIFSINSREYDISFPLMNIIQLVGESAIGKSLMCSDLRDMQKIDKWYANNTLVIDIDNYQLLENLDSYMKRYLLIVVDNADVLITPRIEHVITASLVDYENERMNKWILIGRKSYTCVDIGSVGTLKSEKRPNGKNFTIDYNEKC